jgi:hypothetical protein
MKTAAIVACCIALAACDGPRSGQVRDEALQAGRDASSFPAAAEEAYFRGMDAPARLTPDEARGRNTWLVWTGGNDRMWDWVAMTSEGALDLLKTLSSHSSLKFSRDNRWRRLGLVNEPCYDKPTGPDEFGLWLDKRRAECVDPFEDETKYPGVAIGARGKTVWNGRQLGVGSYYGKGSGVIGLRLFPNPAFDQQAAKNWDPEKYYSDVEYAKTAVRPYRVGMSCAFCHVGPNPVRPPADPENPRWENLSSNVGAQYFKVGRVFDWEAKETNFLHQLFRTSRPGALDTSFIPTDGINNPRAMNAIYLMDARLQQARRRGRETVTGAGAEQKHLAGFFDPPHTAWVPRVLKDGADSVGALAALNRVYLNIGVFSEEMLLHVNPLLGGKHQTPIEIAVARRNSAYWQATEAQTADVAQFLVKVSAPHKLQDALGRQYKESSRDTLRQGKLRFAESCAHCHSSKLPAGSPLDGAGCDGDNYLACLDRYWKWMRTPEVREEMRRLVLADDFLTGNFLSTEMRVPVTLLQTNICSALATNATTGHVWDNFSSRTYKSLPAVGAVTLHHPATGKAMRYEMPAGGRGYTRPPSLVSLWSTAPYLLNNTVGDHPENNDPSVAARLKAFDDGIGKLLWPERREKDEKLGSLNVALIDRTKVESSLRLSTGFLPPWTRPLLPLVRWTGLFSVSEAGLDVGPIPKGTPIGLIANIQLHSDDPNPLEQGRHYWKVGKLLLEAMRPRDTADISGFTDRLLDLNKCPDFEVNRGHYFGASLSDAEKQALIEFLRTF